AALIEVKDGPKVLEALDQLVQGQAFGGNLRLKRRPYQGVSIREVSPRNTTALVVPSYAVVDNKWLVVGLYPQVVQAFVQRARAICPPGSRTRPPATRSPSCRGPGSAWASATCGRP